MLECHYLLYHEGIDHMKRQMSRSTKQGTRHYITFNRLLTLTNDRNDCIDFNIFTIFVVNQT